MSDSDIPHLGKTVSIKLRIDTLYQINDLLIYHDTSYGNVQLKNSYYKIYTNSKKEPHFNLEIPNDRAFYRNKLKFDIVDTAKKLEVYSFYIPIGSNRPEFDGKKISSLINQEPRQITVQGTGMIGATKMITTCDCIAELIEDDMSDSYLSVDLNTSKPGDKNKISVGFEYYYVDKSTLELMCDTTKLQETKLAIADPSTTYLKINKSSTLYLSDVIKSGLSFSLVPEQNNQSINGSKGFSNTVNILDSSVEVSNASVTFEGNNSCSVAIKFSSPPPVNKTISGQFTGSNGEKIYTFEFLVKPDPRVNQIYINQTASITTPEVPICSTPVIAFAGHELQKITFRPKADIGNFISIDSLRMGNNDSLKEFRLKVINRDLTPGIYSFIITENAGIEEFRLNFVMQNRRADLKELIDIRSGDQSLELSRVYSNHKAGELRNKPLILRYNERNAKQCDGDQFIKINIKYYYNISDETPGLDTVFSKKILYNAEGSYIDLFNIGQWLNSKGKRLYAYSKLKVDVSYDEKGYGEKEEGSEDNTVGHTIYIDNKIPISSTLQSVVPPFQFVTPINSAVGNLDFHFNTQVLNFGYGLDMNFMQNKFGIPGSSMLGSGLYLSVNNLIGNSETEPVSTVERLGILMYLDFDFSKVIRVQSNSHVPPIFFGCLLLPRSAPLFTFGTSVEL